MPRPRWLGRLRCCDCLSRCTCRAAIGNERRVAIRGDQVILRVRAAAQGGKRCIAMPGVQFIARLLQMPAANPPGA